MTICRKILNSIKSSLFSVYLIPLFFLFLLGIMGYHISPDYGLGWDENHYREIGMSNVKYVLDLLFPKTLSSPYFEDLSTVKHLHSVDDGYYGPFFVTLMYLFEKIRLGAEISELFQLRRIFLFSAFLIAVYTCFLFSYHLFGKKKYAYFSGLILLTTPVIFSNAFYNVGDISLLIMYSYSLYAMLRFYKTPDLSRLIIMALVASFSLNTRILALPIWLCCLFILLIKLCIKEISFKKFICFFISFNFIFLITWYVFFPYAWAYPFNLLTDWRIHFKNKMTVLDTFIFGDIYAHTNRPWYYSLVYFCISVPFTYLFFGTLGFLKYLTDILKLMHPFQIKPLLQDRKLFFLGICCCIFVFPILLISILPISTYNSWRHLYFIYVPWTILSVYGIKCTYDTFKQKTQKFFISSILLSSFIFYGCRMIENHPFQHLFFNSLAGTNLAQNYDMDYWAISDAKIVRDLIKSTENQITISKIHDAPFSFNILTDKEKENIIFAKRNVSDYLINIIRYKTKDYIPPPNYRLWHEYYIASEVFAKVYKKDDL